MNKGYKYFVGLIWISLASIIFFSSMKEQVVVNERFKKQVNILFPEGWGFFTKNPRDLLLDVYKIENQKLIQIDMSNHSAFNYFGLSRKARVIGYEASLMANEIQKESWKKKDTNDLFSFVNDSAIVLSKKTDFKYMVPGEYLFKLYKPIPYAWANKNQVDNNPFSIVKIKIQR